MNVQTKYAEIDTDSGFAWVEFAHEGEDYSLQLCLALRKDGTGYKKAASRADDGFYWGVCGDANKKAVDVFGAEACHGYLLKELAKIGLRLE